MKKQLISMVLMAAMTVSMLTGCETADGKKTEAPSSENQAAAEVKAEDEGKQTRTLGDIQDEYYPSERCQGI